MSGLGRTRATRPSAAAAAPPRRGSRGVTLVELLVSLTILGVMTTMTIVIWTNLQGSYSFSSQSTKQREAARDAMTRMVREIRDTGGRAGTAAGTGITYATATQINCRSAFNDPDAVDVGADGSGDGPSYQPPLGGFYYRWDAARGCGTLYRWRDTDDSGGRTTGDRVDLLVDNVTTGGAPIFTYTCLNTGTVGSLPIGAPYTTTAPADVTTIVSVQIHLRVDLDPGHSPEYLDLTSSAQPRNQRQT